jgi:hypothetical protein
LKVINEWTFVGNACKDDGKVCPISYCKMCHDHNLLDLWMSKFRCDIFALIINFIDDQRIPYHVIIALFKAKNTLGVILAI